MERYYKKVRRDGSSSSPSEPIVEFVENQQPNVDSMENRQHDVDLMENQQPNDDSVENRQPDVDSVENQDQVEVELDLNEVIRDPGLRKPIEEFDLAIRDQVRRMYLTMGPCQLIGHMYPKTRFNNQDRSFQDVWVKKFPWLEYSISKDAAFCFVCYLFRPSNRGGRFAEDAFTKIGYRNWKKALDKFNIHVGAVSSCHNDARIQFEVFQDQRHNVANMIRSNSRQMDVDYRARLTASLDVCRLLLKQGLSFRGHDESSSSLNRGNFLELLEWYCQHDESVSKLVGKNAPGNNRLISSPIQKDLASACASVITLAIVKDIGDKVFTILVDEARDASLKEQMGVVIRYVNAKGCIVERFVGIEHVTDTCSQSLKDVILELLTKCGLSLSKVRGQGYDGASNMRGQFNGLKALVLKENPYAMYIHCFSHQLQLIIVVVAKSIMEVKDLFSYVSMIVNTVGASCKRNDQLRNFEHERLVNKFNDEEMVSGRGKNQETSLCRPGDTRWGSHYFTLLRLCSMWPSVEKVLENIRDDTTCSDTKGTARGLLIKMNTYQFVFVLHLMRYILGITNELSLALQQKDQNILLAMSLIDSVKLQLQDFRDNGWEVILDEAKRFCEANGVSLIQMEDRITRPGYKTQSVTNYHYYRVEIFYEVVDSTIQELNNRFSETSTELLRCMSCLDPRNSFSHFDVDQLMRLTTLYPEDFSASDCAYLPQQLRNFVANVRRDARFSTISNLGSLAQEMVKTGNHLVFQLVFRMIELALVLPVATASVERAFSAMKIVKTDLRNRMRDEWMNDSLIVYIEKEIFATIDNEKILQRYQEKKTRKYLLPSLS